MAPKREKRRLAEERRFEDGGSICSSEHHSEKCSFDGCKKRTRIRVETTSFALPACRDHRKAIAADLELREAERRRSEAWARGYRETRDAFIERLDRRFDAWYMKKYPPPRGT